MIDALAAVPHRLRFAAPDAAARVEWPRDFGRRYLVSVDTEEEFDWTRPFPLAARGVAAMAALPAMHDRFARAGVFPLYLADYPVVTDADAAAVLRALAGAGGEIGAQLHPWVNPPHVEVPNEAASFPGNLAMSVEAAKLDRLVEALEEGTGGRPRAYRAGRYGIGPNTFALLAARGFRADLSMRARHDYAARGGADFRRIGNTAFRPFPGLVELPLSTVFTGRGRRAGATLHALAGKVPRGRGALARAGLLSRVPLTPEGTPAEEAVTAIAQAAADGERLLHLAFHSPSLIPGNTPYVRNAADLARFHAWWDIALEALDSHGYAPVTLDALLVAAAA